LRLREHAKNKQSEVEIAKALGGRLLRGAS
jgi:hypothetical protein